MCTALSISLILSVMLKNNFMIYHFTFTQFIHYIINIFNSKWEKIITWKKSHESVKRSKKMQSNPSSVQYIIFIFSCATKYLTLPASFNCACRLLPVCTPPCECSKAKLKKVNAFLVSIICSYFFNIQKKEVNSNLV